MKGIFRKAISLVLVLIMTLSTTTVVFGVSPQSMIGPDNKTKVEFSTEKSKYTWGDVITFNVDVTNISDETLYSIKIESQPRDSKWFALNVDESFYTILALRAGEKASIRISYKANNLSLFDRLLMPIRMFFRSLVKDPFNFDTHNYEQKVKVGSFNHRFAFKTVYGTGYITDNSVISFISLTSDIKDIHINQTKSVTFYASMLSEDVITDTVTLQCESSGALGELKDNGVAPDQTKNDGVFTGKFDLKSATRKNETYRAACQDIVSDPIDICFYKDLTQQDFDNLDSVLDNVEDLGDFDKISSYLSGNTNVETFEKNASNESVTFTTTSGLTGYWQADWSNQVKSSAKPASFIKSEVPINKVSHAMQAASVGTASNKNIAVIRPFRSSQFTYDDFRDCANNITGELGGSVTLRDDANATMSFVKSLNNYGIVMFDTHGALADVTNSAWHLWSSEPYILIGEKMDSVAGTFFDADWQSERIIVIADWRNIAIGAKFFDKYYSDGAFDDTVFFLGSCYSMITNSIAEVLVNKGASVAFGYSDVVSVGYCNNTLDEIMWQSMTKSASTARQGFDNAVNKYGAFDPSNTNTYLRIHGNGSYTIASDKGKLSGVVKSYKTKQPIRLAKIEIKDSDGNVVLSKLSSTLNGSFEIKLAEGKYTVVISAYGYLTRTVHDIEITTGNTTYMSESAMLYPDSDPEMGGYVINTLSGDRVSGATIRFRTGHNQKTGAYVKESGSDIVLTSDSSGKYYTDKLTAGYYTAEVRCDEFITAYVDVVAASGCTNQNLNITPTVAANQMRIVLTWGSSPSDLDSHLVGPTASGGGRFHTYFSAKTYSSNGIKYADLDRDDTDSYGPEQTTVYVKSSGKYSYYIHDYSNSSSSNSSAMAKSGAKVVVYMGDSIIATYYVPSNIDGTLWHVFDYNFDTATLTPVNMVSYKSDFENIGS